MLQIQPDWQLRLHLCGRPWRRCRSLQAWGLPDHRSRIQSGKQLAGMPDLLPSLLRHSCIHTGMAQPRGISAQARRRASLPTSCRSSLQGTGSETSCPGLGRTSCSCRPAERTSPPSDSGTQRHSRSALSNQQGSNGPRSKPPARPYYPSKSGRMDTVQLWSSRSWQSRPRRWLLSRESATPEGPTWLLV